MPTYTFKEGACAECGCEYTGLICDEELHRNTCPACRDSNRVVESAKTISFREFVPYFDTGLGIHISGWRQRQEEMTARGLAEMSDYASNPNYLIEDIQSHIPKEKDEGLTDEFGEVWNEVVVNEHYERTEHGSGQAS